MLQIHLEPEVKAKLAAEAQARGVDFERFIVEKLTGTASPSRVQRDSIAQAIEKIFELRNGNLLGGIAIKDLIHEGRKH